MKSKKTRFRQTFFVMALTVIAAIIFSGNAFSAKAKIPADVSKIFGANCVKCHGGSGAAAGLNLSVNGVFVTAAGKKSNGNPEYVIIAPGSPDKSYLIMKITKNPSIKGSPMPLGGNLSEKDIKTISGWIASLPPDTKAESSPDAADQAFAGWTVGNTPTAEMLDEKSMLLRISHRFESKVKEGYKDFYGLDGPAVMLFSLGYGVSDDVMINIGRTNASADAELNVRYRVMTEGAGGAPVSAAIQANIDWETKKVTGKDRLRGDAFMYSFQLIGTKSLTERLSLALVPAVLFNPNVEKKDEKPLIAIGIGGRFLIGSGVSIIGDISPIVSGFSSLKTTYGFYDQYRRYDSWTLGIEKLTGGHVFQLFVTNAEGISTDQYLNGGDLRIQGGNMRLGFVIYRVI